MQKKIIALAIAAAFSAPAFADSTVYGIVDAAVASLSSSGNKSDMLALSGGLSSSRIGVKTAEDLNNGMKAVAVLEYGLDTQRGDGVGNARQEILAIAGDFGTFATGYAQTTAYDWAVKFDPTSGSAVSPLQSMTKGQFLIGSVAIGARATRALAYISPDMGGLTVAVNYSTALEATVGTTTTTDIGNKYGNAATASSAADTKLTATMLSATYVAGPLSVGGVYATTNTIPGLGVKVTDLSLGGSYDLGVAKLFATYQNSKSDASDAKTDTAMSFSAVAPVGPGAVLFSYAKNDIASTAAADNGSGFTVGWLQGLSKTTTFYAAYHTVKNDSDTKEYGVAGNLVVPSEAGGSATMLAVGLKKVF